MAAVVGTPYSPPSPPDTSSSATMTPVYPDRPIRPLPRRSLRERLSPEVAEQIPFPTAPVSTELMFNVRYNSPKASRDTPSTVQEVDRALIDAQDGYDEAYDSLSMISRYREFTEKGIPVTGNTPNAVQGAQPTPHSIASSNDSADGYDSFENTNNKKKRKIPAPGGLSSHTANVSASLSNDLANMGISYSNESKLPTEDSIDAFEHYLANENVSAPSIASSSGTGISGAGRGRYGRSGRKEINGRSPLGAATGNNLNNWQYARSGQPRSQLASQSGLAGTASPPDHGIISAAIAEAATSPVIPSKGQENISLLEQQQSKHGAPAKTQFTFTCESDTSKAISWPGDQDSQHYDAYTAASTSSGQMHRGAHGQKGFHTQGTQTSPVMDADQQQNSNGAGAGQQNPPAPRKPRRSPAKRYAIAARERRLQQEYTNYHHPPKEEEVWICEFCEYESIFGTPPEALVRQYEIKDRRERKRLAEKRRLLEKAKMKGRKNKKGSKNTTKNSNNTAIQQQYTDKAAQHSHDGDPLHMHDTHSDEYYAEDYDDDPDPTLPMPPEVPNKVPQPAAHGLGAGSVDGDKADHQH